MNPYWTPLVERLDPYVPGEQPDDDSLIKLNTNENPYGPSPGVLEAIRQAATDDLRLYPDPEAKSLRESLAHYHQLAPEQVFVGNGSDEVLALTFQAFFTGAAPLLFPDITYSFYPVYCNLFAIDYQTMPLSGDLSIDLADYAVDNGGIIFPNPNAPTALALSRESIRALLEQNRNSVVVVDEAYVDFGAESVVSMVSEFPNLLVCQTFSKSRSLAGMRIGMAVGDSSLIQALCRVKDSFNSYPLDRLAQVAAVAALDDSQWFEQCCSRIIGSRETASKALEAQGYMVTDSKTNFLFVRHSDYSGQALFERCRDAGILVRYWSKSEISDYIRITIGTEDEMEQLVSVLKN